MFFSFPLGREPFLMVEHRRSDRATIGKRTPMGRRWPTCNKLQPPATATSMHQKRFCTKGFHWDKVSDESLAGAFFSPPTWVGAILDGRRPCGGWQTHAAGQVLTSPKQTSIPGNDDANATRRGFAQRAFIGTRCPMSPWSDVFLIPHLGRTHS